ncbi:DUF4345 domain-containing protein [Actinoplanes sp. CA-252034]|uniref:DUF4345 domain-containing protein n=1 Tax=Actinoplanes sp. CA-252034 TaxID=3239906 RepID=UPI003D99914B
MTALPQRLVLTVSGLVIVLVGAAGTFAPVWFREAGGVPMPSDAGLLSETRAAGALVLAAGVFLIIGGLVPRHARPAAAVGAVVYLVTAVSRLLSLAVDGSPGSGLLFAAAVESALGLACAALLMTRRSAPVPTRRLPT